MKVYWHECGQKHGNLGDKLTPLLLDYFGVPYEWSPPDKAALFGTGSILHRVPLRYRGIVWSTGALFCEEKHDLSAASVFAIRGKLSLSQIECCERDAVCLGDGGLLSSLFFRPCRKRYKLGVIPHYAHADEPIFAELEEHPEMKRIDICDEPRSVIQQIGQCEHIISSSLHGLIIADSLGVPNRWIDVPGNSPKILGSGFKVRDYYSIFDFENPEPELLRPRCTLNKLLPLFENYRRPGIEDRKFQLLESFRSVVEPRSRYQWDLAKQDIVRREGAILQRLERHDFRHIEVKRRTKANGAASECTEQSRSFDEFRGTLKQDSNVLGRFFLDCLSQVQKLHELGIVHGDIRDANVIIENQRPILINLGWSVPSEYTETLSHAHYVAADLRALGKLLRAVSENHPHFATIASLMMQSQPNEPIIDLATASIIAQLLLENDDGSRADNTPRSEFQQPQLTQLSRAVTMLLEAIAAGDRKISSLRSGLESARACQWRTEARLAALELARIVPQHETYVRIDGDEWRDELAGGPNSVPFLERNGAYWGPPEDNDAAIRELMRLQRRGVGYVVFGKPAFWWLEYYADFRNHLDSSADCCHKDELLVVYRLKNDPVSKQELDSATAEAC